MDLQMITLVNKLPIGKYQQIHASEDEQRDFAQIYFDIEKDTLKQAHPTITPKDPFFDSELGIFKMGKGDFRYWQTCLVENILVTGVKEDSVFLLHSLRVGGDLIYAPKYAMNLMDKFEKLKNDSYEISLDSYQVKDSSKVLCMPTLADFEDMLEKEV